MKHIVTGTVKWAMESDDLEPVPGSGELAPIDPNYAVSAETAQALRDAVPTNTNRGYAADWFSFTHWCETTGRRPLPTTPENAAEYVTFLKKAGPYRQVREKGVVVGVDRLGHPSAPRSIERALSAIRTAHAFGGYPGQPDLKAARLLINGYRRSRSQVGMLDKKAAPLTLDHLRAMVGVFDLDNPTDARNAALLLLGYSMMTRRSEITRMRRDEAKPVPQGLQILIPFSKTDQKGEGELHGIEPGDPATCPVRHVRHWRALLEQAHPTGVTLFPAIDMKGRICGTENYGGRNTTGHLNGGAVTRILRNAGERAGLEPDVIAGLSGHSIRSGGATAAYSAGNPVLDISRRGRWKDGSAVFLGYVRDVDMWKNSAMKNVL